MSIAQIYLLSALLAMSPGESVEIVVKGPPAKTLKGEVVRENLKGIILKNDSETIAVAWTDIQSVDGRPAAERLAKVKQTLKDLLCPDCKGGLVTLLCPDCLATGKIPKTKPCDKCGGTGTNGTPCPAKGCDKGKTECPGPCLKRSVGVWKEFPGHGLARIFIYKVPNGVQFQDHFGRGLIVDFKEVEPFPLNRCPKCRPANKAPCKDCKETGTFVEKAPVIVDTCIICGGPAKGAGQIDCTTCLGMGTLPCDSCLGTKAALAPDSSEPCKVCKDGIVHCATCSDTGIYDPKVPAPPAPGILYFPGYIRSIQPILRKAIASIDEVPAPSVRVTLRDGRSLDASLLQRMYNGIILAMQPKPGEIQVLVVYNKYGVRYESIAPPRAPQKPPEKQPEKPPEKPPEKTAPDPAAKPPPGPDTIVLKDGTTVNGKILGRSDLVILIKTPEGKTVKIETEKVAEIRSEKK